MTRFGKALVFVNLALALMAASWAAAVYGNRVPWGGRVDPGTKSKVQEREEQFKEATAQLKTAMDRCNKASADVLAAEQKRPAEQKYYRDELAKLETGIDANGQLVAAPVMELVYEKGQLKLDPKSGRPAIRPIDWQRPHQPLLDLNRLGQEYDKTTADISKEKQTLDGVLAQEKELTEKLNGDGKVRKGLRRQMDEVQEALVHCLGEKEFLRRMEKTGINVTVSASRGLQGEQEWLMPLLYNRKADLDIVTRRQQRLESRLQELRSTPGAALQE